METIQVNEMGYTQLLGEKLWEISGPQDTDEYDAVLEFLNSAERFRSFGEGIISVLNKSKCKDTVTSENAIEYIISQCNKSGVDISNIASKNTLTNWFRYGMRPKKGEATRKSMFALAFACSLSLDDTVKLFNDVYMDRAFDYRNQEELIYYFCIKNKLNWQYANNMIEKCNEIAFSRDDGTEKTAVLFGDVSAVQDADELIAYIDTHYNNFTKSSLTAKEEFEKLLERAKTVARKEVERVAAAGTYAGKWTGGAEISNNLLYEIITEFSVTGNAGTKTVFNNIDLPKEIRNRFPEAGTFSKKEMSHEERRKAIILLFSYIEWSSVEANDISYELSDYTTLLNSLLLKCNYPNLYYGNPFDWLFLYCTISDRPLDTFKNILYEAAHIEE